ncbi:MAG: cellulase family glycosylhydrolase [Terracidiphilus sp.]
MHFAFTRTYKQTRSGLRMAQGVFVFAALLLAFIAPGAWAQGTGYWHTNGNKILDSDGTEVRMAGINWYGAETPDYLVHGLWAQDYHTVLNTIKSLGYNVIRIPFSNQLVESDPVPTNYTTYANGAAANQALDGQTALEDMDTIIAYAGSIGLRVILDNHRSEAGETNEANGLWYTSAYPQTNWIADWRTMATRYSASKFTFNGNPTVIGMDLRNEPHLSGSGATTGSCWTGDTATNGCPTSLTTQNWPVAAEAAGDAILAINPKLLIFVEGNDCYSGVCGWQGGNLIGVASNPIVLDVADQLVYSAHDYGPNLYQQAWFNSSTTPASLDAVWNKYWGYISADDTAPVWVGEFGTDNTSADIENTAAGSQGQWFESMVGYLQSNPQINWTYWALNGEDTYALLDNNYDATPVSSLKQSLLEGIQFPLSGGSSTPGFTLAASASSLSVTQGSSATDTITVDDVDGFTGSVTFTASGLPSGVTASFNPASSASSSVLTLTASSTAATGPVTVTVTGTSGSTTATTTIALTVNAKPILGFTLAPSPSSFSVTQGSKGTSTITLTDTGGFTGSVSFTASGLPSGVTASFSPPSSTSSSVLTLTASPTAATGSATVTVTGTSASTTATTTIALTVAPSGGACTVDYVISPQNTSAFGASITIVNGPTAITSWTLTWTFANGQTVAELWNGIETQSGANVTVKNESYNGSIAAGATLSGIGFNGTWNGTTNAVPTAISLNGTACTVN